MIRAKILLTSTVTCGFICFLVAIGRDTGTCCFIVVTPRHEVVHGDSIIRTTTIGFVASSHSLAQIIQFLALCHVVVRLVVVPIRDNACALQFIGCAIRGAVGSTRRFGSATTATVTAAATTATHTHIVVAVPRARSNIITLSRA